MGNVVLVSFVTVVFGLRFMDDLDLPGSSLQVGLPRSGRRGRPRSPPLSRRANAYLHLVLSLPPSSLVKLVSIRVAFFLFV